MITVCRERTEDELILSITGHAGYAQEGPDIVCAGASALCCAAMGYLTALEDAGAIDGVAYRQQPGDAFIRTKATKETEAALALVMKGYKMLSEKYPAHVRIIAKGVKPWQAMAR